MTFKKWAYIACQNGANYNGTAVILPPRLYLYERNAHHDEYEKTLASFAGRPCNFCLGRLFHE
jgi:hypothetical protein